MGIVLLSSQTNVSWLDFLQQSVCVGQELERPPVRLVLQRLIVGEAVHAQLRLLEHRQAEARTPEGVAVVKHPDPAVMAENVWVADHLRIPSLA